MLLILVNSRLFDNPLYTLKNYLRLTLFPYFYLAALLPHFLLLRLSFSKLIIVLSNTSIFLIPF